MILDHVQDLRASSAICGFCGPNKLGSRLKDKVRSNESNQVPVLQHPNQLFGALAQVAPNAAAALQPFSLARIQMPFALHWALQTLQNPLRYGCKPLCRLHFFSGSVQKHAIHAILELLSSFEIPLLYHVSFWFILCAKQSLERSNIAPALGALVTFWMFSKIQPKYTRGFTSKERILVERNCEDWQVFCTRASLTPNFKRLRRYQTQTYH